MTHDMRRFYDDPGELRKWGAALVGEGLFPTEAALVGECFRAGASVLDVGCGGGREAFALAARGLAVTAVDYTPAFVKACRAGAAARGLSIDVREADATALPFGDGEFDHVMMVGQLLGHVRPRARRLQALREIQRVMRPGAAIVSTNAVELSPLIGVYFALANLGRRLYNPHGFEPYDAFVRRVGGERRRGADRPVFHWYRSPEFVRDAMEAGWRVEKWLRRWQFERDIADRSLSGETFYVLRKDAT
jgi:SAM-dependent methyltransferase